jgi:hypothetical protein
LSERVLHLSADEFEDELKNFKGLMLGTMGNNSDLRQTCSIACVAEVVKQPSTLPEIS